MDSRERVYKALAHESPDRCPVDFWAVDEVIERLCAHFGVQGESSLLDALQVDLQFVFPRETRLPEILPDGSWFDYMGVHRKKVKNAYCVYEEYASYPLQSVQTTEELAAYDRWPDADAFDWADFPQQVRRAHDRRFVKLHTGGIFEFAWALRGYEQFMIDLVEQPEIVHFIMGKLCDFWCAFVGKAMEAAGDEIDMVYTYDDIAAQNSLLMSRAMLEEFIYPYHRRLNSVIKSYGKPIMYHSCGAVRPVIGDLCGLGIDVLNPLQPLAKGMDFAAIKREYGDRLCFHGGIDLQRLLPTGSPAEVRGAVRAAIAALGAGGGYIMTSAHYIQNDVPTENILAMYDPAIR
ncbi:MAG: uroporphyrinogen decarboxylase family protein [Oscillospiraceae bacterium]|nr:uroporphyrinogen decarboxylase family protein [Oscillospiraceae bacterium]